ncbi:MAG: hypothetical protein ACP5QR_16570 [Rhizomicrobium sp.]
MKLKHNDDREPLNFFAPITAAVPPILYLDEGQRAGAGGKGVLHPDSSPFEYRSQAGEELMPRPNVPD